MAVSLTKKKSRLSRRKVQAREFSFFYSILAKVLLRIPALIVLLFLIFLWSSSTTIISGKILHVCVSSRKLNNLYCISAGTQTNFEIPIQLTNTSSDYNTTQMVSMLESSNPTTTTTTVGKYDPLENSISRRIKNNPEDIVQENSIPGASSSRNEENLTTSYEMSRIENNNTNTNNNISVNVVAEKNVPLFYDSSSNMDEELATAYMDVEEQLRLHRSWVSSGKKKKYGEDYCEGKRVFVYELPSKFNKDLLEQCSEMIPWVDLCKFFSNGGFGEKIEKLGNGWYQTHQYALEPIFHARILNHPCRVYNENEAKMFYVPFYGGLDILRWHFKNVSEHVKDSLSLELVRWLENQKPWFKKSGKDHIFVLGKISWDFRRGDNDNNHSSWGTKFLELDEMQNPIKLLIERQPWHVNDIGIPHPTYFHPQTDDDIIKWQMKIIGSYNRRNLVSFGGAARPDSPNNIRSILIEQCTAATNNGECRFLDCSSGACDQPESLINLFMDSEFCLQPPGDSPTRKSVFDSLVSGCIPVIFDPFTAYYQYPWHLPEDHRKYSVFIDKDELRNKNINVVELLSKISHKEKENMRKYIVYELLPGLVYADPNSKLQKFQDAFSITMNNLLESVDIDRL